MMGDYKAQAQADIPKGGVIDYKARAEFWKAAAHKNLDYLAEALDEVQELRNEIYALKLLFGDHGLPQHRETFYGCSILDLLKEKH